MGAILNAKEELRDVIERMRDAKDMDVTTRLALLKRATELYRVPVVSEGMAPRKGVFLDGIDPMARMRLASELGSVNNTLPTLTSPIDRVRAVARAGELRKALGGAPDNSPVGMDTPVLSDDPNDPNYRYKDTGYIADSRKEIAANQIKSARESGQLVRMNSLDWDGIEKNPRAAAELITKSNLFGKTDWESLKANGIEPGAAFLIDRIYASIGAVPAEEVVTASDTLRGETLERARAYDSLSDRTKRQDYARALETIRDRLEKCKTVDDVLGVLEEIRDEFRGVQLSASQSDAVLKLREVLKHGFQKEMDIRDKNDALFKAYYGKEMELVALQRQQEARINRKWKPDPELNAKIAALSEEVKSGRDAHIAFVKEKNATEAERDLGNGRTANMTDLEYENRLLRDQISVIESAARKDNLMNNPVTRGWLTFGPKFIMLLNYRAARGSDTFAGHVANAKGGRIKDWAWAEKETVKVKKATKQEVSFQLKVVETFTREGGRPVTVDSTTGLKDLLGLRDVQSGNWVLKDPNSAKFHVEQVAMAMTDLGDLLGIEPKALALGGRLAVALGARGSGGKNPARAHYESVHRVINLTKMGGGGFLGHEYIHFIDNVIGEMLSGQTGNKHDFASVSGVGHPEIDAAFAAVRTAMLDGNIRPSETIAVDDKLRKLAAYNITDTGNSRTAIMIKNAGNATDAILAVDNFYKSGGKRSEKVRRDWRNVAAAYYAPEGANSITVATGTPRSSFAAEAILLDNGKNNAYWSRTEELFARAFQSYIEDRMTDKKCRNDYLSAWADNKYHVDPLFGIEWKPFPEGEERTRINAAFDVLFDKIRDAKVFENALANPAILDAIFGVAA